MDINQLPAECISSILAFTSPKDACRSAVVSPAFRSAVDSDDLWTNFLPSDYRQIISQASSSYKSLFPNSLSKKALYFRLCDHLLFIGSGNSSFVLEKGSGKKCYMIGARDLVIIWGSSPRYWTWKSIPTSRFPEVAELRDVWWLEIKGKIEARSLSPKTKYAAYFVFKLVEDGDREGFEMKPVSLEVHFEGVEVGEDGKKRVILDPPEGSLVVCEERSDGWMEVEMGEFFNELGDDGTVIFHLMQIDGIVKSGLIVEGIEVRPKND